MNLLVVLKTIRNHAYKHRNPHQMCNLSHLKDEKFIYHNKRHNKRHKGLNRHLSIRDSTMTSCQKSSYLHISCPIIQQWHKKAALYSLHIIAINVMYIDRVEDNAYSLI